ncbi:helix-turn-helix domain-containing protein [Tropicimonas sp. S265A]|uniref:helix-turn-helix domain-containing protein n=1 Tax=Tropicimonas sp. S265A TaxID=3415134 RepID=UPI003C7CD78B
MSDDAKAFGALVRQRRTALKLTQENLADAALGNLDRKGMISQIENGKIPNITSATVKKVAEALSIDVEEIPTSLRWSEAIEVATDTNTVVHKLQAASERSQAIDDKVLANTDKLVELLSEQAQDFKIKEGMLIALARRYAEGSPHDFDAAFAGLEQALEVAVQDRERGKLPSNTDDAVNVVIARVDALNETGDIDQAAALLAEEEARAQAGLLRLYEKAISQAILTRDVDAAVSYELKKLPLEAQSPSPKDSYAYLRSVFVEWYNRGDQRGLNFDGAVAVELIREMVRRYQNDEERIGSCLSNLGLALHRLGSREADSHKVSEAITVFRAALEKTDVDHNPLDWATTQMNLGSALRTLGTRNNCPRTLNEAVEAYRAALTKRTRDRVPMDWAITKTNLGNALSVLGERESGTETLEEALSAYRDALKEFTRDRAPSKWAMVQMNLSTTLQVIGERENGTEKHKDAVAGYRAVLQELSRSDLPLEWARTQMNLGNALQAIGEREVCANSLEEAATAYRLALEEYTRDRVPLDWARAQMNLGVTLRSLGQFETGTLRLEESLIAYRSALEELTRERDLTSWAFTNGNEAVAMMYLADRTDNAALAARALGQLVETESALQKNGHEAGTEVFAKSRIEAEALVAKLTNAD